MDASAVAAPDPVSAAGPQAAKGQVPPNNKKTSNRRTLLIGGAIVVLIVLAIVLGVTLSSRGGGQDENRDQGTSADATEPAPSPTAGDGAGHDESPPEAARGQGLSAAALDELHDLGMFQYVGQFAPASSTDVGVPPGTTLHTFDTEGGEGPVCIAGTSYSLLTREADPSKLLIFLQGGGACWQDFYNCNPLAEMQIPGESDSLSGGGIWDWDRPDNPFRDYSLVYLPYCDGSAWLGDNDVDDPAYGSAIGFPVVQRRHHRGVRNLSAGIDVARAMFPNASQITVAGTSAGGIGAATLAPFFVRFVFGNGIDLTVFNDAGPLVENLAEKDDLFLRASDWGLSSDRISPLSCDGCDAFEQGAVAWVDWRLDHDTTVRDAIYQTDADDVNRFFTRLDSPEDQAVFRDLVVTEHGRLHDDHPEQYKCFIVAGDTTHGALQSDLFYTQEADGVMLRDWVENFLIGPPSSWENIVEA